MLALFLSLFMGMFPLAQTQGASLPFDVRAKENLIFGKGEKSGETYYDVVVSREAVNGVPVKLPYTQKGGKFSFDLHHRIALTPDYADAEVTTIIEVITGSGTSLGRYTLIDKVRADGKFEEPIVKRIDAEVDKFVTPYSRKSIVIETVPGPQSLSIVGNSSITVRGASSMRIDTPGVRIAMISKMKFYEASTGTRLTIEKD